MMRVLRVALVACSLTSLAFAAQRARQVVPGGTLSVVDTVPAAVATVSVTTPVVVMFDRPVDLSTVDRASFRVFGRYSGPHSGAYTFLFGGRWIGFVPSSPFSAGEVVWVNLSHDLRGLDGSRLRAAGYAFQFQTDVAPSSATFTQYDVMSNNEGEQTRIYGAQATDLNNDGYLDLTTVNEVSADLRVFLNLADGSGFYGDYLTPEPIGVEASPNDSADFDNDGFADIVASATSSESLWIVLGNGNGTFGPPQEIPVGGAPHGVVALDVDGDADFDLVNCNRDDDDLSLMINDGNGVFGAPSYFDSGVGGEWGLAAGDMNGDGITDLVPGGQTGANIRTLLGNGNGTFTPAGPAQPSGGFTWVVALGDVDGDGDLDASTANSSSGTGGVLKNNGNGTFTPVTTVSIGFHTVSTDLGDLDGDGDLDWVISSFGGGFWRLYRNNGSGGFTFWQQIPAPANPSCAIVLDTDNDQDLDLALTDEIADVVVLMRNQ
jgi:VCBS repeat protein/Big-like domain-containing protein